jgi:hypothetical protein
MSDVSGIVENAFFVAAANYSAGIGALTYIIKQ